MIEPKKTAYGTWQVRWREKGKQRAKSFPRKELALKFAYELSKAKEETQHVRQSWMTFEEFSRIWYRDYCKVEKSEIQWIDDLAIIENHLLPAFGKQRLSHLSKQDLVALRQRLKTSGRKPKTINNITGLAKKILNVAVEWEYLKANPWASVKPLKLPEQPFAYWTPKERDRFLRFAKREKPDHYSIWAVACHTGLRQGELLGLKMDQVDFDREVIIVTRSYSARLKKTMPYTKSKKIRQVPMNKIVIEALSPFRLLAPDTRIFSTVPTSKMAETLKAQARRAGVKPIRFHDLRHTFASCLAMAGVALPKIQALLGHASFNETQRYAHLHPDSLEGITDVLVHGVCTEKQKVAEVVEITREFGAGNGTRNLSYQFLPNFAIPDDE